MKPEPVEVLGSRTYNDWSVRKKPHPEREPLFKSQEIADHWGVSVATISNLVKDGMPFLQITGFGRRKNTRRYRLSECERWLRERQKILAEPTVEEPLPQTS